MKQLLRFYSYTTSKINLNNQNYQNICQNNESSSFENCCSYKHKHIQPFSLVIRYFMSSSHSGGMKFKSRFTKKNDNNNQSGIQNQNSTKEISQKKQSKLNHQDHLLQLTEQYLRQLKHSQCFENQSQSLQEFSLDQKQKSLFLSKQQEFLQQENIQESFNWMEKLVYDQQKNLIDDSSQNQTQKLSLNQKMINKDQKILVTRRFDTDLPKNVLIENSRKFLQYSCHLFTDYQQLKIMDEIKQFVKKIEFLNNNNQVPLKSDCKKKEFSHFKIQTKRIRQQKQKQQLKLFRSIRKIFYQSIADPQLVDKLLLLLSKSDPKILKLEDIDKFIYKHDERVPANNLKHRAQLEVVFRNLHGYLQKTEESHSSIEEINKSISSKMQFLQQVQKSNSKKYFQKSKYSQDQTHDLTNTFQQFSKSEKQGNKKNHQGTSFNQTFTRQKQFKLLLKKTSQQPHQQFQIKQSSLSQIERVLFKNTKIIQDKIVLKKEKKNAKHLTQKEKQEQQKKHKFGQNWIYAYQLPYSLTPQQAQNIIQYISKKWGEITQFYVYPYKNFLEKKQHQVIHVELSQKQKRQQEASLTKQGVKQIKRQRMTDKLLQKINKEKYFKLNKSSMVFKFKNFEDKNKFLSRELRLYGLNLALYRNIRFQQAQSKTILALSMVPWGCLSTDLINSINCQLKSINVQVTFQKCIIAKGYIFIQFDSFYQALKGRDLLNNLVFQNQRLKAQINYGSSKMHLDKYKGNLQMDHYDTLICKLKQINCFYNQLYQ